MKKITIFIILTIVLIAGVIFSAIYFSNIGEKSDKNLEADFPKNISVSTQEELFREVRNAVDEHLNK